MTESKFEELLKLNINDKVEKKKSGKTELTYLSWAYAVSEMEKSYPEWEYSILEFDGLPYQFDPNTGYLVWTEIKAGGKTKKMWLPVMDGSNKAMKNVVQEYFVKRWSENKANDAPTIKRTVEAATMFDINKTIMRCLVKNIAMFGLGLYIYAGEDLPESDPKSQELKKNAFGFTKALGTSMDEDMKDTQRKKNEEEFDTIKLSIMQLGSVSELKAAWESRMKEIRGLGKYAPDLFAELEAIKDREKKRILEE